MGSPASRTDGFRFVPIRSLSERHKSRMLAHLLALDAGDRYLRFGYAASDSQVSAYIDHIEFDLDEIFGVFNRRLELIAMAHVAYESAPGHPHGVGPAAEFGVSVATAARGRGYGSRLFDHAVLRARNRGVDTLVVHALSENMPMLAIARKAGATMEHMGSDSEARLKLPPDTPFTQVEALVEERVAELDYHFKEGLRLAGALVDQPEGD